MDWFLIFSSIAISSTILGAIVSMFYYPRFNEVERKFVPYIIISAVFEIIGRVFLKMIESGFLENYGVKNTLPGLHLFTLAQFIFLCIFFHHLLKKYSVEIPLALSLIIGSLLIILNSMLVQSIYEYCSYSKVAVEIFIIVCSMIYFLQVFLKREVNKKEKAITLFVSAVFINAGMSILLHLFSNEIMVLEEELTMTLWTIRAGINLISQFVILFGIYLIVDRGVKISIQN